MAKLYVDNRRIAIPSFSIAGIVLVSFFSVLLHASPWAEQDPNQVKPLSLEELRALPQGNIEDFRSTFSHIIVRKEGSNIVLYFKRGGSLYKETEINLSQPDELVLAYGELAPAALLYAKEHKRFLLLGLGGGAISNYFHRFIPDMYIDGVEIDGGVASMAVRYFMTDPGVNYDVHVDDARRFVQGTAHKYDLVMGDAYGGGYIPEHLITLEFYREVKSILRPGGVLFLNIYDDEVHDRTIVTLREIFDHTHTYYSFSNSSRIVVAFDGKEPDKAELLTRAIALQRRYGFSHDLTELLKHRKLDRIKPGLSPYRDE
ncbi:MAG: fused MFS/spermidine synthase [Leptospiraceae bacterium]